MNYALMRNSLVCLPTGSGKTLISIAVIHAMLRINKQKMAVFAVKTNPLVEQQANAIKSEIPELRVNMLSGQIDPAVTKKTKKVALLVVHPQFYSCAIPCPFLYFYSLHGFHCT